MKLGMIESELQQGMELLIVTPLQEELHLFLQSCSRRGYQPESAVIGRLPVVRLPDLGITLAVGGTGKAQFALQTQHLLDGCVDWDLVICAGASGALVDDVSVGDVVVGTTSVEHDYNNQFSTRPRPRFDAAQSAITGLRRVAPASDSFRVHFGAIASGDEDVVDPERGRALHQATDALAVAWEGAGGARACRFSSVPYVEIRGVTDTANQDAPYDFEANLELAMHNVAKLITSWINHERTSQ
jgi:adenosylhomocysteine nucleosidase